MNQEFKIARSTWTWALSVLGTIGSAITMAAMVKRGLDIDLWGMPRAIYEGYAAYRDFVFSVMPFHLPIWLKDFVTLYVTLGLSFLRAMSYVPVYADSRVDLYSVWEFAGKWPAHLWEAIDSYGYDDYSSDHVHAFAVVLLTIFAAVGGYFFWNHISQ